MTLYCDARWRCWIEPPTYALFDFILSHNYKKRTFTKGWTFRKPNGTRAKTVDYKENIFTKLEKIQRTTTLIDLACKICNDYRVQRSGRCWFTTECANQGVDPHKVELQCCWSTDRATRKRSVQRSMIHTYSEVRNMKEVLIHPSKSL